MVRKATRIGVLGNYLPRRCGIATFTGDLCDSLAAEEPSGFISVAAVNDTREGYKYPERVRFQIAQNKLLDYLNAAAFFNIANFDVLCVQHEFGIFGGAAGDMVLAFMRELRMPVITTLHTVLADPDKFQRAAMEGIAKLSDRLVVMSAKGAEFLRSTYGISDDKIALIPHGVPDVPFVDPNYYKDLFGVEGRRVLLTFGLLSPNKGIENVIRALPPVVQKHPDVVYIIVGATHPHVLREKGEEYRFVLQGLVRTLDLGSHVMFHDRFVEVEELHAFLGCADICLTPYLNEAQIVSGALSFCLGAGKAVVSTPYWHAREILADERGVLVPFGDSRAVTQVLLHLLKNDVERHAMRKRAYSFARKMIWRRCAREYLTLFAKVLQEREKAPRKFSAAARIYGDTLHVPSLDFTHLKRLTDSTGIIQHAKYTIPDRGHGYCTDDNARALVVAVRGARLLEESEELDELNELAAIYLSFLDHAFVPESGRFHNFMGYDRCWTDQTGTEDAHGRALWGLGVAAARAAEPGVVSLATRLFIAALPAALTLNSPRSMALSLIGIHEYLRRFSGDVEAHRVREKLAAAIFDSFQRHGTGDWPRPSKMRIGRSGQWSW